MFIMKGDIIMSDSDKLRKTYGDLNLALSFFLLAIAISSIWLAIILPNFITIPLSFIYIVIFFFPCFTWATEDACKYFVGVCKKKIDGSDKAKLLRINGLISLTWSFAFFAISICCLWGIFVFWKVTALILILVFALSLAFFSILITAARDSFMSIKKIFDEYR